MMKLRRRKFLHLVAGTVALLVVSQSAWAQITMIVPLGAGSSGDAAGRLVAERMGRALGQSIVVENVAGADGSILVGRVARARPDGYTIGFGFLSTNVLNGAFYSLSYDLLGNLIPISPLATMPGGWAMNPT
jgi:tripartite-type tricarboxylate transporter receptor subunit TctC